MNSHDVLTASPHPTLLIATCRVQLASVAN